MFGYFGMIGHPGWLVNAYYDIPDGIKQLLHVLTAVNMRNKATFDVLEVKKEQKSKTAVKYAKKKPFLTFCMDAIGVPLEFSWFLIQIILPWLFHGFNADYRKLNTRLLKDDKDVTRGFVFHETKRWRSFC